MSTSQDNLEELVTATSVSFTGDVLHVQLSDDRGITLPLDKLSWLEWLYQATPTQRDNWSIEPGGYAIYWEDLDDGIEIMHLLGLQPLT